MAVKKNDCCVVPENMDFFDATLVSEAPCYRCKVCGRKYCSRRESFLVQTGVNNGTLNVLKKDGTVETTPGQSKTMMCKVCQTKAIMCPLQSG